MSLINQGGISVDDRGVLTYVPFVDFARVKRFYVVENFSTDTVRAFHGHLKEEKFVYVLSGSAIVVIDAIKPDPLREALGILVANDPQRFVLSARKPTVLHIPAGFMNGFRPLEPGTKIMFFSTSTVEESQRDDYRWPANYYGHGIWEVESR